MSRKQLFEYSKKLGLDFYIDYEKFEDFKKILLEWNEKLNLTGITDSDEIDIKHFLDSLTLFKVLDSKGGFSMVDVGTGAGFPAIPVKITNDNIEITCLEALNKRLKFIDAAAEKLEFENLKTVHIRAEDAGRNEEFREKFDVATARAVAELNVLAEYCLPLVKVGGIFIAMKGKDCDEEIDKSENAIKILGGEIQKILKFSLTSDGENERTLAVIKKVFPTPKKYPRGQGKPKKEPLI